MLVFKGQVFADYHQFFIADVNAPLEDPPIWNEESYRKRIVSTDRAVTFRTVQDEIVPVQVSFDMEKFEIESNAIFVSECSMESSGELLIAGCTDYLPDTPRFSVLPGRLRVSFQCLEPISVLENNGSDDCLYHIKLWPDEGQTVLNNSEGRNDA